MRVYAITTVSGPIVQPFKFRCVDVYACKPFLSIEDGYVDCSTMRLISLPGRMRWNEGCIDQ